MSGLELKWFLVTAVFAPLLFAPFFLVPGWMARGGKLLVFLYAFVVSSADALLLYAYFHGNSGQLRIWWMQAGVFPVTALALTGFLSAAVLLWLGFKRNAGDISGVVTASVAVAGTLAAMLFLSTDIISYTVLWVGISAAACLALVGSRLRSVKRTLLSFAPWVVSDLLLISGSTLCLLWLNENKVLIEAPLKSGSEMQVVVIMALFLASSLIRLGAFPFNFLTGDLFSKSDSTWSAFFMGVVNYVMAGSRLVITATLMTRFVATDWSIVLTAIGLLTLMAGPVQAARAKTLPAFINGMFVFQTAFLIIGTGLFSRLGWQGAMFCLLAGPFFIVPGIMAAGRIFEIRGTYELGSRTIPPGNAAAAFLVLLLSGLAMSGMPPSGGFLGKAVVFIGAVDKSFVQSFNALVAALIPVACAFAVVSLVKAVSQLFSMKKEDLPRTVSGPARMEGLVPLGLCAVAYAFGLFPGLLTGDVLTKASRYLVPSGFSGPGVAFHGSGSAAVGALDYYKTWATDPAVFCTAVALTVVAFYFLNRASCPSEGPEGRFQPFEGGVISKRAFERPLGESSLKPAGGGVKRVKE
ncbi:MAG: hypothetical protein JXA49_08660 [Actinobacteria bacterium]|nr:hypothetical protein [Actinomycetota bacterium]